MKRCEEAALNALLGYTQRRVSLPDKNLYDFVQFLAVIYPTHHELNGACWEIRIASSTY